LDAVLNWVLQGCLATLCIGLFLKGLPVHGARVRYRLWWLTLIALLGSPALPFVMERSIPASAPVANDVLVAMPAAARDFEPLLLAVWGTFAALLILRVGYALFLMRTSRRRCGSFPIEREAGLRHWSQVRWTGRCARLAISEHVRAAAVLGGGAPVIAVSPILLRGLDDDDLDRVVVHEWAHVQRWDDVAIVAQQVIRATVGWHPAIWWICRQLDLEREAACDERAVAVTGSAKAYARCLTKLAAFVNVNRERALSPAMLTPAQLTVRIGLLVTKSPQPARGIRVAAIATTPLLVLASIGLAGQIEYVGIASPINVLGSRASLPAPTMAVTRHEPSSAETPPQVAQDRDTPRARAGRRRPVDRTERPMPAVDSQSSTPRVPVDVVQPVPTSQHELKLPEVLLKPEQLESSAAAVAVATDQPHDKPAGGSGPNAVTGDAAPQSPNMQPSPTPWVAAADAGVAIGQGSQKAAVATAGFFKRLGKSIGGSF
jgi:beta-lactamase regulating signal transducer with metallopeptidase domain